MAKKNVEEKINLDSILFKCRDILRKARNDEANRIYFKMLEEEDDGLYIRDIMRGGINNDDPRIWGNLFK